MKSFRIRFEPSGKTATVCPGTTLLDAARSVGIPIASACGGEGICGRCRVQVLSGTVAAESTHLLTQEQIREGFVLACQARVSEDTLVRVPVTETDREAQILVEPNADQPRRSRAEDDQGQRYPYAPIVSKLCLHLPPPTLEDPVSCHERLSREIRRRIDTPHIAMALEVVQSLPSQHRAQEWTVTATLATRGDTIELLQVEGGDRAIASYAILADIGTSTIVVHLLDLVTSRTLDMETCYNSQMTYGAELTRRIAYAKRNGPAPLQEAVVGDINRLVDMLVARSSVDRQDLIACLASGNTTMMHFLLGLDAQHIRKSPYVPATTNPPPVCAADVGIQINPCGVVYSMPAIGAWVGGDITSGILATGLSDGQQLTLLIDIGTNGEIVLGNADWMIACAASAGPAFEGSGITSGMHASQGAIEHIKIGRDDSIHIETIGNVPPRGICGSGLIDAIAGLFECGRIDRSGRLQPDRSRRIREANGQLEFVVAACADAGRQVDLVITQSDIENVLRAKAAIYTGTRILLESTGHTPSDIDQLLIAGGFGNHLDGRNAILLGMIPDLPVERIHFVGNTSILGARMAMLSSDALVRSERIARSTTCYDLSTYLDYYGEFMSAKFLPHTHLDLFPSIAKSIGQAQPRGKEHTDR